MKILHTVNCGYHACSRGELITSGSEGATRAIEGSEGATEGSESATRAIESSEGVA